MALKDNLKRLREQAGYTQAKSFSKVAGIPYSSYAPYERGAWPNEKNLIKKVLKNGFEVLQRALKLSL